MVADLATRLDALRSAWMPPPELSLSEWADESFYLSAESAAEPGRWHTLPYQRGIMDALTDPTVERVSFMKSARVGATKMMNALIAYHMAQDPCPILLVQPTVEDAEGYSKEEIAPMLRDCPSLAGLVLERKSKSAAQTILHKVFPGGILSMVGANSGRGFRRVSRRVVIFDEVDGYPPSAGNEGDQIKLGIKRTEYYANRKIFAASTPLVAGASRIEDLFEQGDRRRYHVPCPHCGHRDYLVFSEGERGHWMQWPENEPGAAYFVCRGAGCIIEHKDKRAMLELGAWIADAPFSGHASFHIWAAYSLSPNATWGQLAAEFLEAKRGGPEKLKTFVNTALGETWHDRGEAPDWEKLYSRRESYSIGSVPAGVVFLTAGVDVQKDRFVYEVVGWDHAKRSWSVDAGILMGDTSLDATWRQLDDLLGRTFPGEKGAQFAIHRLAIDSGYNTQQVYGWARRHGMARVIAGKGVSTARVFLGTPSPVDVTIGGKRLQRGYKVWPLGVSLGKSELYGWLRLPLPGDGEEFPPGWCHFPEYDQEFFRQLTAEHLVTVTHKRTGFTALEWHIIPNRENHWLDARILARAAASSLGLDRARPQPQASAPVQSRSPEARREQRADVQAPAPPPVAQRPNGGAGGWFGGSKGGRRPARPGGWFDKRR